MNSEGIKINEERIPLETKLFQLHFFFDPFMLQYTL